MILFAQFIMSVNFQYPVHAEILFWSQCNVFFVKHFALREFGSAFGTPPPPPPALS